MRAPWSRARGVLTSWGLSWAEDSLPRFLSDQLASSSCQAVTLPERAGVLSWGWFSGPTLPVVAGVPLQTALQSPSLGVFQGLHGPRG